MFEEYKVIHFNTFFDDLCRLLGENDDNFNKSEFLKEINKKGE